MNNISKIIIVGLLTIALSFVVIASSIEDGEPAYTGVTIKTSIFTVHDFGRVDLSTTDTIFNDSGIITNTIRLVYVGHINNVSLLNDTIIVCNHAKLIEIKHLRL